MKTKTKISLSILALLSMGTICSGVKAQSIVPLYKASSKLNATLEDFSNIHAGYGYEDWGTKQYAPYFDMGAYPQNPRLLYDTMNDAGVNHAFLGFAVTDSKTNLLVWGGANTPINTPAPNGRDMIYDDLRRLREEGKDVGIAFGGAGATALPETVKNVADAVKEYKAFIKAYGFTHIDFDIEGNLTYQSEANKERAQVIKDLTAELATEGQPLSVSYTLALGSKGIEPKDLAIIEPSIAAGDDISKINFMAFDYGTIPGTLEQTTERALQNTHQTLKEVYAKYGYSKTDQEIWNLMGMTSMTTEDDQGHSYTPDDVNKSINFANTVGMNYLSMWSINRDSKDNDYLHPGQRDGFYSSLFSKFQTNDGSKTPFKTIPPFECPSYNVEASYNAGARVHYKGKDYLCIGWANPGDTPEKATWAWRAL